MPIPISTAADLRGWRVRLGWTQARAAAELRIHLVSFKRLEGGRAEASGTLLRLAELLELHHGCAAPAEPIAAAEPEEPAPASPRPKTAFGGPFGRLGSRVEGAAGARQLAEEAEDRESTWRAASGDSRPLVSIAALVAQAADLG